MLTKPNSRTRKKFCTVLGRLLKFFEIPNDLREYRGDYSVGSVAERQLPSDEQIVEVWGNIPNPGWQWIFGMLAAYGLRNHEAFFIDLETLRQTGVCHVLEGKTYSGKVWAYPADWVELFGLRNPIVPPITLAGINHADIGGRVTTAFQRYKIPFNPYDLRHAFAQRLIRMGVDSRLAAAQMRHSHALHTKTYNAWLSDDLFQEAWEKANSGVVSPSL